MKNNQKGFIGFPVLIAIVLGIVVLLGGAYFVMRQNATPQVPLYQDQTNTTNTQTTVNTTTRNQPASQTSLGEIANWKTYTNQKYSIEFKYPSAWVFCDSKDQNCNGRSTQDDPWIQDRYIFCDNIVPPSTLNGQKVFAYCNNPNLMIIIGKSSPDPFLPMVLANTNKKESISLGGVMGAKYFWVSTGNDNGFSHIVYSEFEVKNGNYTYTISPGSDNGMTNITQILSSFKFTK